MTRVMQYSNPSRELIEQLVLDALKTMLAVRYSYVIRNHLALDRICNITTAQVYRALQKLERDGLVKRHDTGRGQGSSYRFRWSVAGADQ